MSPDYRSVPYKGLALDDSIICVKDRHLTEYIGVFQIRDITDCGKCYCVSSFFLENENGEIKEFNGSVVSARTQITPEHVVKELVRRDRELPFIAEGYDLYFDGLIGIEEIGRVDSCDNRMAITLAKVKKASSHKQRANPVNVVGVF